MGRIVRGVSRVQTALLFSFAWVMACDSVSVVEPRLDASDTLGIETPTGTGTTSLSISDVGVSSITATAATVRWKTTRPALGGLEYGTDTTYGSEVLEPGAGPSPSHVLDLTGLAPSTTYHFRVTARESAGSEVVSEDGTFTTSDESPSGGARGIWIGPEELAMLETSGAAWENLRAAAEGSCGAVDLSDQDQTTNVCVLAKALVFASTGDAGLRDDVIAAITQIVTAPTYVGRALALGRELGAYVLAADLIDLPGHNAVLDATFRTVLVALRTTPTSGAASDLIDCHEKRPNNWGAHCGATRAAIAVYLGDTDDLERTARVFKGYLGDRSSYAGFEYGGPEDDLSWQCDPERPVGINPAGCSRDGLSLDGVLPDDQRRGGSFTTTPPRENYVWEALQGLLAQAVILSRAGYPVWEWEDRALLRATRWLHEVVDYPAEGDDTWQPHVVNHYYRSGFPASVPAWAGKNVGWTDWTHR